MAIHLNLASLGSLQSPSTRNRDHSSLPSLKQMILPLFRQYYYSPSGFNQSPSQIYQKLGTMQLNETLDFMSKTQNNMYSTIAPITTPRRRYYEPRQSVSLKKSTLERPIEIESAQLAATFNASYRKEVKTPNLPQIKRRRSLMLEEWINNALQKDGDLPSSLQSLQTIKKYEFDKATLRNLNLSHETIQKLYNGLYAHTQGVKHAFNEMLAEAASTPREDNFLPKKYFRVFLKLLESSMPIKSTFKIIEEGHLKEIGDLRKQKLELSVKLEEERENTITGQRKLKKQYEELDNKFQKFMSQYKILESTLQMYEVNLNEEVYLRLKFEEKINQVYTCYEELKEKYETIRQELSIKKQTLAGIGNDNSCIKLDLQTEVIKNEELQKQILTLKEQLSALEGDLTIKNQQMLDVRMGNQTEDQQKLRQETALDELIVTIKLLKKQKLESESTVTKQNVTLTTHLKTVQKLSNDLSGARQKNDELYLQCHASTLKMFPLQKETYQKSIKIQSLTKSHEVLESQKVELSEQLLSKTTKIDQLQLQVTNFKKINLNLDKQYQSIHQNIAQLKDVKDRYERINQKLKDEVTVQRKQTQNRIMQLQAVNQRREDLEFQVVKVERQAQSDAVKISGLQKNLFTQNTSIEEKKQLAIVKLQQVEVQVQQKEAEILIHKESFQKLLNESNRKDSQKLKKLDEISLLRKTNSLQQAELKELKLKLDEMSNDIIKKKSEVETQKKQLANKAYTISKKKNQVNGEIVNLEQTITTLKEKVSSKAEFVHPMIAQDLSEQILRLEGEIQKTMKKHEHINATYESMEEEIKSRTIEASLNACEMGKLNQGIDLSHREVCQLKEDKKQLEKKCATANCEIQQLQAGKSQEKESFRQSLKKAEEKMRGKTEQFDKLTVQLERTEHTLKVALTKPKNEAQGQQTDEINSELTEKRSIASIEVQTDNPEVQKVSNAKANGKKLTVTEKLRGPKVQEQSGTINHMPKVEQRQFKAALKMTYMRK